MEESLGEGKPRYLGVMWWRRLSYMGIPPDWAEVQETRSAHGKAFMLRAATQLIFCTDQSSECQTPNATLIRTPTDTEVQISK